MAVFKSLTIDGENSLDYGVFITGKAVYNAPGRVVDMVTIPGRNGSLVIDQGRFENIEITYPAGAFGTTQTEYSSVMRAFRNFLASRYRYVRLEDDYHPDEYRLGLFKSGLEADPVSMSRAGEFDIVFDCKPQRFLKSGEIPVSGADWTNVQTASGSVVTIDNSGNPLGIKSLTASIEPVQSGSGTTSPTNVRPISGRTAVSVYVSPTESEADGDTYNTSLGRTVYGGTLDLISGVLTVTYGLTTIGALNWIYNNGGYFYSSGLSGKAAGNFNILCDTYATTTATNVSGMSDYEIKGNTSTVTLYIKDSGYTNAATFKAERSGVVIAYELATSETFQVTAKDIELLTGTNKIWASTGDVTVEYGHSPFYNPTEFPSKPLIKVTGTGTLMVGGVTITITGVASQTIYIDCESMEIYKMVNGEVQSAASLVTFSGNDFPVLSPGSTSVSYGSGITALEITPHWWRI